MSKDSDIRTFEIVLAGPFGSRVVYGDEYTTHDEALTVWLDDVAVFETAKGAWILISDETSRVASEIAQRGDATP